MCDLNLVIRVSVQVVLLQVIKSMHAPTRHTALELGHISRQTLPWHTIQTILIV